MKQKGVAVVAGLLLLAFSVAADTVKIAVVDMDEAFNNYYKTKISVANLQKQAEVFKAYADKLEESRQKLMEEFRILRDESQNIALSKAEQESKRIQAQDKYRQVKEKEAELTQYNRTKMQQLTQERAQMRETLIREIRNEINKRATLAGYTLVLDKSGSTLNNLPVVIYHIPSLDITEDIIRELNRGIRGADSEANK